jgi:hypothetical protein
MKRSTLSCQKRYLVAALLFLSAGFVFGQSRQEIEILGNSRLLHKTVFGTKDSATLEGLFASTLTYGHSSGKVQNRQEAIAGITHNKSVYTDSSLKAYNVLINGNVATVRYEMRETETNGEGKASPLKLGIMLVWVQEKGKWKLFGRQAVKLPE